MGTRSDPWRHPREEYRKESRSRSKDDEPIPVRSVADLIDFLVDRYSSEDRILWFRGQEKSRWDVSPSIWRDYQPALEEQFPKPVSETIQTDYALRAAVRHQNTPEYREYGGWLSPRLALRSPNEAPSIGRDHLW